MKNLDIKKFLVFVVIIAIVALIVFFGVKQLFGENKPTEEEVKKVEEIVTNYFEKLSSGYATVYNGIDVLYSSDKTTLEDLELKQILNTSIDYASNNEFNINVSSVTLNQLKGLESIGNIEEYLVFNADGIRSATKELFDIDLEDNSAISEYNYLYDFVYVYEYDVYLLKRNSTEDISNADRNVEFKTIKTTKKGNEVMTTVAVAYTNGNGSTKTYAKDNKGTNVIAEDVKEFPSDNINDFDQFTFTLTQTDKGDYIFKSVEKVK